MSLLRATFSLCLLLPWTASAAEDVRVYRCVSSNGAVALQDTPCNSGRQQVRDLQRPRDPAPRVVRSDAPPAPPGETPVIREREVRHVYIQPPQPMYECVSDDGRRYTSDNNEGNSRWVPLWTSVWLPHAHHGPAYPDRARPPARRSAKARVIVPLDRHGRAGSGRQRAGPRQLPCVAAAGSLCATA